MSLQPGQKLMHYEIVEHVGEGGMGVVWKALDTTLGREVAIKVLPAAVAQDPERLARLHREAKVLAKLSHANIAAVYGLHEAGETKFLAMEYVAGEDVHRRLARGRLPLREALDYARQVAEALQTAHENGVVHRDLKPANVMLTPAGVVKVLDFGLAKGFEVDPSSPSNPAMSPTLTSPTMSGAILGTAGYMSPEQARGHAADKRSDIFSFGAMLFEMLTGSRSFEGDTVSDTLASVLKLDPDWSLLPGDMPRGVERLLRRCLRKDPRERLHDIADARIEIVEALEGGPAAAPAVEAGESRGSSRRLAAALFVLGLLVGGAVAWVLKQGGTEAAPRRFVVHSDDVTKRPSEPRISPDGRRIVYRLDTALYVHDLMKGTTHTLDGTDGADYPFWSPDSSTIAYRADGKLWKVDVGGGTPTRICNLDGFREAAWNEAGTIGIVHDTRLLEVSSNGGEPRTVLELDEEEVEDFHGMDVLPGKAGWVVLVHDQDGDQAVEVIRGTERRRLVEHRNQVLWSPRHAAPGLVLYRRSGDNAGVWAVPVSGGDPFLVAALGTRPSAAADGTLAYLPGGGDRKMELTRVGLDGTVLETYGQPEEAMFHPLLSPDGRRILFSTKKNEEWDLWAHDVSRGVTMRLTSAEGQEGLARWSPDGGTIYFYSPVGASDKHIYALPADGDGEPREIARGDVMAVSADGRRLVFVRDNKETGEDLWTLALDEDGAEPEPVLTAESDLFRPALSPDGKWLAYASDESGRTEVYVKPFPERPGKWRVSVEGGTRPQWNADGKTLYFARWWSEGKVIYAVDVTAGETLELSAPRVFADLGESPAILWRGYEVLPDGQSVLAIRYEERDEPENENAMPDGIRIVQNWLTEF